MPIEKHNHDGLNSPRIRESDIEKEYLGGIDLLGFISATDSWNLSAASGLGTSSVSYNSAAPFGLIFFNNSTDLIAAQGIDPGFSHYPLWDLNPVYSCAFLLDADYLSSTFISFRLYTSDGLIRFRVHGDGLVTTATVTGITAAKPFGENTTKYHRGIYTGAAKLQFISMRHDGKGVSFYYNGEHVARHETNVPFTDTNEDGNSSFSVDISSADVGFSPAKEDVTLYVRSLSLKINPYVKRT